MTHGGHRQAAYTYRALKRGEESSATAAVRYRRSNEAPRVHHAAGRRGDLSARGALAAHYLDKGRFPLTSKIRTLDHVLEQAKLAAFVECAGVPHPVKLRSFQPHVAPGLN